MGNENLVTIIITITAPYTLQNEKLRQQNSIWRVI